jgi:pentose-5-phosphate-3-epimerase
MSREIRITPSILNADVSQLNSEIERIAKVSDLLHLDVMDDIFVPNFTFDFATASSMAWRGFSRLVSCSEGRGCGAGAGQPWAL